MPSTGSASPNRSSGNRSSESNERPILCAGGLQIVAGNCWGRVRRRPLPHRSLLQPFHGEPGSPRGRFSWLKSAYCELNMKPYNWAIVPRRIRASSLSVLICVSAMMRVLKGGRMRSKDSSLSKISKRQCQFIPLQRPRAIQPILASTRGKPPGAGVIETAARAAPRADRATSLSCYLTPFPTLTVISLADLDARN